jgi:hypothetical protein
MRSKHQHREGVVAHIWAVPRSNPFRLRPRGRLTNRRWPALASRDHIHRSLRTKLKPCAIRSAIRTKPGNFQADSSPLYSHFKRSNSRGSWQLELVASMLSKQQNSVPQGLKPMLYAAPTARLKPCPFNTRFMQPVLDVFGQYDVNPHRRRFSLG